MSEQEWQEILCQVRNNEITELNLSFMGNEKAESLAETLKVNSSLISLDLMLNNIQKNGARALAEALKVSSSLATLDLGFNDIRDVGTRALAEALKKNSSLTHLDLKCNHIRDIGVRELAEALKENTSLTYLYLDGNYYIGEGGARWLAEALRENSSLTLLNLRFDNIGKEGARALAEALKVSSSLATLDLGFNVIGDVGTRALAEALKKNSSLTSLNLRDNEIRKEGARLLAEALKENSSLTLLNLGVNNIGKEGASALAEVLRENNSLNFLDLIRNEIGEAGAKWLAEVLKENNSLTSLNLDGNRIGDEGARSLAVVLKENSSLTFLNLEWNNIGDEGTRAIAKALIVNTSLTYLELGKNNIGDEGAKDLAEALTENSTLIHLNLELNNIRDEGTKVLAESLKVNKCLLYYLDDSTDELRNIVNKNQNNNENLAKRIKIVFSRILEALRNGSSIDASRELNLEELKLRCAAINYMLKKEDIGATPEIVLFFNIAFKKLQNSEESYNSVSTLFKSAITELVMELNEGYYEHPRDYPGLYVQDKLLEGKAYKIIDEEKGKLLSIPAVLNYKIAEDMNFNRHYEFALKYINKALSQAPGEPRIMFEKAKILYLLGCFQQADEEFAGALGSPITTPDKLTEMRDWFEKQGEFNKAIALQKKLIRDTSDNSELAKLALLELENHNPSEALKTLDKLIQHEPEEFSAYHLKARLHYILGDGRFDEVIKAGEKMALPKLAEYRQLADWLDKHEDTSRADRYCKKSGALERKTQGLKILQNWLQADNTREFVGLNKLLGQINSDSVKYKNELQEFEPIMLQYNSLEADISPESIHLEITGDKYHIDENIGN